MGELTEVTDKPAHLELLDWGRRRSPCFASSGPFPHHLISDLAPESLAAAAAASVPGDDWPHWVRYANDDERKRTCNDLDVLPEPIAELLRWLQGPDCLHGMRLLSRQPALEIDPTLHGGGLHVSGPGGRLQPHVDYALHPRLAGYERRWNVVLFLSPEWRPEWGGRLQLWDDAVTRTGAQYTPRFNSAVAWEPTDVSYHGVSDVSADAGAERVTLAAYYLLPARPWANRKRALFVPRRG